MNWNYRPIFVILLIVCANQICFAEKFTPGNVLVTQGTSLLEYTRTGELIQQIPVPHPDTNRRDTCDIVVDRHGKAYILNIAPFDNDYISVYDPEKTSWSHHLVNAFLGNGSDGDLSISLDGKFLYTKSLAISLEDFSTIEISISKGGIAGEITMGFDGNLYVLQGGSPRAGVRVLDPNTFEIQKTLTLRDEDQSRLNARGIAVTRTGNIFVSAWDGRFYAYDSSATLIDYCQIGLSFNDLDLSPSDGIFAAGSRFGTIAITDMSFETVFTFETHGKQAYICFVPFEKDFNTTPVADAGKDLELSADGQCGSSVTLDGSASSDEDGDELSYFWFYNDELFGEGIMVETSLGLGEYTFTLIVNDGTIDSLPDEVVVTVVDKTPPQVTVSMKPAIIWAPNNKMVKVTPTFKATDNCSEESAVELVGITCNQKSEGDIKITDEGIFLRAKRDPKDKEGRVYTVTYKITDGAGNETVTSSEVKVPHDQGRRNRTRAAIRRSKPSGLRRRVGLPLSRKRR